MKTKTRIYTLAFFCVLMIVIGSCNDDPEPLIIPPDCIADIDRNIYKTVTIGSQVWMAENLKVTHYRNGDPIISKKGLNWQNTDEGACGDLDNNPGNIRKFGKFYNGYAIMDSRNIAPEGWHIPSDTEWLTLIEYLGGQMVAGGKLKDTSILWMQPNIGATNISGFAALPAGYRSIDMFNDKDTYYGGYWWSSTEHDSESIYFLSLRYNYLYTGGMTSWSYKQSGLSVRCVKD